jgi:hypothetical protein
MMRLTAVEAASVFAVVAGSLAVIVPACLRTVRVSRTAEASLNLERLTRAVVALPPAASLASTPLTPTAVPRGAPVVDSADTWDHPTWKALGFSLDEPHWYAYRVEVDGPARRVSVVAHGDLDGDGMLSTYTRTATRDATGWVASPALVIDSDLE